MQMYIKHTSVCVSIEIHITNIIYNKQPKCSLTI